MPFHHYNLGLLFYEILDTYKDRTALCYPGRKYLYQELSELVDKLSVLLINKGIRRGDVIAIANNKRPLSYGLMLAALRLGIPYVNLDAASPTARNLRILQVCDASYLFYDDLSCKDAIEEISTNIGSPLLYLDEDQLQPVSNSDRHELERLSRLVDGSCIAYIMFTSGSTGMPKGVAVTHQNVLHFIAWGQDHFNITINDIFANLSPMYFDNSVFDFYVGLFSGASLCPVPREMLSKPYDLVSHVGVMGCTIWFSVPSLLIYLMAMKALTSDNLPSLRSIVFGGEGYPKVELYKLYNLYSRQARLVNVYGPTECTCICSAHTLTDDDFLDLEGLPTLGHLNPNFDYRIIDDNGRDADSGELCLIGPNVAAGYFNDPERTANAFTTINDASRYMKRMYRTGDLVREEYGNLYFIGRRDNQIKHMGYRIELEEVESALVRLPQVSQAAVIYQRVNTAYGKLIGFVACADPAEEEVLLRTLSELLPDYMLPNKLVVMSILPKNSNGKIDRHKLLELLNN